MLTGGERSARTLPTAGVFAACCRRGRMRRAYFPREVRSRCGDELASRGSGPVERHSGRGS